MKRHYTLYPISCLLLISTLIFSCKKKEKVTFPYTYSVTFTVQGNPTAIINNEYIYDVWLKVDNTDFLNTYQDKDLNLKEVYISNASMGIILPPSGNFDGFERVVLGYGGEQFVIPPIEIGPSTPLEKSDKAPKQRLKRNNCPKYFLISTKNSIWPICMKL